MRCQCPLQPLALPDPASRQQRVRMCRTPACKVGHARRSLWMHSEAGLPLTPLLAAGCGVAGLLQSVQQLLVQILQTSRQQQALLESLASDTVSHLHLLSHSLVQVGETLHQLLLRPQAPPSHGAPHIPLFGGAPPVPLLSGLPSASPDPQEECRASPGSGCALP